MSETLDFINDTSCGIEAPDPVHLVRAYALGINDGFSLRVRYGDGSIGKLYSGEVSVRRDR